MAAKDFRYATAKVDLTTPNVTSVYTCPARRTAVVDSILVSEDSGNADTITLTITSGSDVFSLYKTKAIGANGTTELLTHNSIYLTAGEIIKATAATANRLHVIVSVREVLYQR